MGSQVGNSDAAAGLLQAFGQFPDRGMVAANVVDQQHGRCTVFRGGVEGEPEIDTVGCRQLHRFSGGLGSDSLGKKCDEGESRGHQNQRDGKRPPCPGPSALRGFDGLTATKSLALWGHICFSGVARR